MTQKVVINRNSHGFTLSTSAIIKLIEMQSPILKKMTETEYYGSVSVENDIYSNKKGRYYIDPRYGQVMDGGIIYTFDDTKVNRSHPDLLSLFDILDDVGGEHSHLKVVEIPDDVEYTIEESDMSGVEWIEEKHRKWY